MKSNDTIERLGNGYHQGDYDACDLGDGDFSFGDGDGGGCMGEDGDDFGDGYGYGDGDGKGLGAGLTYYGLLGFALLLCDDPLWLICTGVVK